MCGEATKRPPLGPHYTTINRQPAGEGKRLAPVTNITNAVLYIFPTADPLYTVCLRNRINRNVGLGTLCHREIWSAKSARFNSISPLGHCRFIFHPPSYGMFFAKFSTKVN